MSYELTEEKALGVIKKILNFYTLHLRDSAAEEEQITSFNIESVKKNIVCRLEEYYKNSGVNLSVTNLLPTAEDKNMYRNCWERANKSSPIKSIFIKEDIRERMVEKGCSQENLKETDAAMDKGNLKTVTSIDLQRIFTQNEGNNELRIKKVVIGDWILQPKYNSSFPNEYLGDTLFICKYCLEYMNDNVSFESHMKKCLFRYPPGKMVYKDDELLIFEIDGSLQKLYCQSLCLLAKMYLCHKVLYYDVGSFLFYILVEESNTENRKDYDLAGYFSKERNPNVKNNVSCIVVFPYCQGRGFGNLLIEFSHVLTVSKGKTGGPETPLSNIGFVVYAKYWSDVLIHEFHIMDKENPPFFYGTVYKDRDRLKLHTFYPRMDGMYCKRKWLHTCRPQYNKKHKRQLEQKETYNKRKYH